MVARFIVLDILDTYFRIISVALVKYKIIRNRLLDILLHLIPFWRRIAYMCWAQTGVDLQGE